jgi:hypothetical protein
LISDLVDEIISSPKMVEVPSLMPADRCDRCPAMAAARVLLKSGRILDFCQHHYGKHEPALAAIKAVVVRVQDVIR